MNDKKKKSQIIVIFSGIFVTLCVIISVILLFLAYKMNLQEKQMEEITQKIEEQATINESQKIELEEFQKRLELAENEMEANAELMQSEETTPDVTIQPTMQPEPQVNYLENLELLSIGEIVPIESIDFNNLDKYFCAYSIQRDGTVFSRINGKSYQENPNIKLEELRYLKMLHYDFNGNIKVGELIVNYQIADRVISIFKQLFNNKYGINSMRLIDDYWVNGDPHQSDYTSIDANNTSAFCYRTATGGGKLSRHALGMAIDINPQQNPYVSYSSGTASWSHSNANDYIDRNTGLPYVITHEDLCYKLFIENGFSWGGDWTDPKDYQHFEMN